MSITDYRPRVPRFKRLIAAQVPNSGARVLTLVQGRNLGVYAQRALRTKRGRELVRILGPIIRHYLIEAQSSESQGKHLQETTLYNPASHFMRAKENIILAQRNARILNAELVEVGKRVSE